MASVHVSTTIDGYLKQRFANSPIDLATGVTPVVDMVPFEKRKKLGKNFTKPVMLTHETGVTQGVYSDGSVTLEDVVTSQMEEASVQALWYINRTEVPKHLLERAVANGEAAYGNLADQLVKKLGSGLAHRLEVNMRYDGKGLGILELDPGDQTTSYTLTITKATWAPEIWRSIIGAKVDVVQDDGNGDPDTASLRNTAACTITKVDLANRQVTVSCTANELDNATTGDHIVWRNIDGKEMTGIASILSNTGVLFGVNGSIYPVWAGNTVSAGGVLTYDAVNEASVRCIEKGLDTDSLQMFVSPHSLRDLQEGVLSQFEYTSNNVKQGVNKLSFACAGKNIEVIADNFCKRGEAHLAPFKEHFMRIGTKDFELMEQSKGGYLRDREDTNTYLLKAYSEQVIFCDAPGMGCLINGIVDSTSS